MAALVGLLAACSGPAPAPSPAQITLGTVDTTVDGGAWVQLDPGSPRDVTLVAGAQGGFHIWLLYRVRGVSGMALVQRLADRLAPDGSRQRVLTTAGAEDIEPGPDGEWQVATPQRNFMCPTPIGVPVEGQLIEMSVQVSALPAPGTPADAGAGQVLGSAVGRVTPSCPSGPGLEMEQAFCHQICNG